MPVERGVRPVGEEWTFDDLYRTQYGRMVVLARAMTGSMAQAEEVVQDAFVQVLRRWSSVDHPLTYLRIAVVNGCRSLGRRRVVETRQPARRPEPVLVDEAAVAVRDALLELTPRQRAAVVLRYFEDLPEREIAEALDCRPGTVKSLLSRGLAKLEEALADGS